MAAARKNASLSECERRTHAFRLVLDAAATPDRVAAIAEFVGRVFGAANARLPDNAVTMVVTNYALGATVNPRTPEGAQAAQKILRIVRDPKKALARDPTARAVLLVFAKADRVVKDAIVFRLGGRRQLATIANVAAKAEELTRESASKDAIRGTTIVYTRIYRVGQYSDDSRDKVRVRLDGDLCEVELADGATIADFHAASAKKQVFPVHMRATWVRDQNGKLRFDADRTRALRVDLSWSPMNGRDFVAGMDVAAPSGYVDEDDVVIRTRTILGA